MKITLKKLTITNFKGIKSLEIDFSKETTIEGANRTGKTTVFDAFNWLLFGKTSDDRDKFNIKPLDEKNNTIPNLENEVFGIINTDGREIKLRRTHREKWIQKRGESEKTFSGNETVYEWNDVPCTMAEYNEKIGYLVDENLFKLVTNPLYFNSLHWEKRRNLLMNLIDDSQIDYFVGISKENKAIIEEILNQSKNIDEKRKELASKIRKTKEEMSLIPSRIDEAERAKPEAKNWDEIENKIGLKLKDLGTVQNEITDISAKYEAANKGYIEKQNKKTSLQYQLTTIENNHKNKFLTEKQKLINSQNEINSKLSALQSDKSQFQTKIGFYQRDIKIAEREKSELLARYKQISSSDFTWDNSKGFCDKCGQSLPNSDELKENSKLKFLENKENQLADIKQRGLAKKAYIDELEGKIDGINQSISLSEELIKEQNKLLEAVELKLETFEIPDLNDLQAEQIKTQIAEIEKRLSDTKKDAPSTSELNEKAKAIQTEIDNLRSELKGKEIIANQDKRIAELKEQESAKAQEIADMQKIEFAIENFTKNKMSIVESEINKMFTFVKFRLFEMQINGAEKDVCDTLINGVPWIDANTEGQINGGLDIINVFSRVNDVFAPIFIDNKESISELLPVNSQIILLKVNENEKQLKIIN